MYVQIDLISFRPLSGYLISKKDFFIIILQKRVTSFRPLSGYLISKLAYDIVMDNVEDKEFPSPLGVSYFQNCPPDPAILLAFLTLLRGKSFSCIFFLYLTYTIASKCSIYAVRGKIIFFSNKLLHTPILTHISHVCIKI